MVIIVFFMAGCASENFITNYVAIASKYKTHNNDAGFIFHSAVPGIYRNARVRICLKCRINISLVQILKLFILTPANGVVSFNWS